MSIALFTLHTKSGTTSVEVEYANLFAIGYSGRNMTKTMEHIKELERDLGVPAPKKIPTIFQCSNNSLTQEELVHFVGSKTCGEVEYVIVLHGKNIYIGLGSDHTDRELESVSVPKAKQVCPKPMGKDLWDYGELKDHWEDISLCSYQKIQGTERLYQRGTLGDILPVEIILEELKNRVGDVGNAIVFSGTVPLEDGFKYGETFRCEMTDPILKRKLAMSYGIQVISEEER